MPNPILWGPIDVPNLPYKLHIFIGSWNGLRRHGTVQEPCGFEIYVKSFLGCFLRSSYIALKLEADRSCNPVMNDASKREQVVFECMQKVAEIIVQSRVLRRQQHRPREMNSKVGRPVTTSSWRSNIYLISGVYLKITFCLRESPKWLTMLGHQINRRDCLRNVVIVFYDYVSSCSSVDSGFEPQDKGVGCRKYDGWQTLEYRSLSLYGRRVQMVRANDSLCWHRYFVTRAFTWYNDSIFCHRQVQQLLLLREFDYCNAPVQFYLHVEELQLVRHSMEAWKANLHTPLGIDVFWQEHRGEDVAPNVDLLERWEIL